MPNRGTLGGYTRGLHQQVPGMQKSLILRGFLEAILRWRREWDSLPLTFRMQETQLIKDFRRPGKAVVYHRCVPLQEVFAKPAGLSLR
jgi:hypothetical protein